MASARRRRRIKNYKVYPKNVAGESMRYGERPPPTTEAIAKACLVIQSTWSDAERERRGRGSNPIPFVVPVVSFFPLEALDEKEEY